MLSQANLVTLPGEGTTWARRNSRTCVVPSWRCWTRSTARTLTRKHRPAPAPGFASCAAPIPFRAALAGLQAAGDLVVEGAWVRCPGSVALAQAAEDEVLIWSEISSPAVGDGTILPTWRPCATSPSRSTSTNASALGVELGRARRGEVDEVAPDHFSCARCAGRNGDDRDVPFRSAGHPEHLRHSAIIRRGQRQRRRRWRSRCCLPRSPRRDGSPRRCAVRQPAARGPVRLNGMPVRTRGKRPLRGVRTSNPRAVRRLPGASDPFLRQFRPRSQVYSAPVVSAPACYPG